LSLHAIGVGDEDTNRVGSGGGQTHTAFLPKSAERLMRRL
jgi:hypothetical protein